jgi:hypothetical protein
MSGIRVPYNDDYSDNQMKLLVVSNVNLLNGLRLRARLLDKKEQYDYILFCGPYITSTEIIKKVKVTGNVLSLVHYHHHHQYYYY